MGAPPSTSKDNDDNATDADAEDSNSDSELLVSPVLQDSIIDDGQAQARNEVLVKANPNVECSIFPEHE